ncbi:MAG: hypothetical protein IMW89_16520, partial [Ktedonobacteraceae bacterium]|nr:hypothetical protein [Ktedonobacteraceae bacterium]
ETGRQLGSGTALALSLGSSVLLLAITFLQQISSHPLPRYKLIIRLSAAVVTLVLAFVAVWLGPPVLAGLLAFTLLATTVLENAQYDQPDEMAQQQKRREQQEQSGSGDAPEPTV